MTAFAVAALLILAVYIGFMRLANQAYDRELNIEPVFLLPDYERQLAQEDYDNIPLDRSAGYAFIVFDERGGRVYASDPDLNIAYDDAKYLFDSTKDLTSDSITVMEAMYGYDRYIVTDEYHTTDGERRLLAELIPFDTGGDYEAASREARLVSAVGVLVGLAVILVTAWILNRRIRRALRPVGDAIVSYQSGKRMEPDARAAVPAEFQGIIGDFNDMMDRVELAQAERARVEQSRNKIIADLSHDLKTPLTVISGYSGAMLDGVVDDKDRETYLKAIHQKALYTSDLMDELFEYSKMEHPNYTPRMEAVDYSEFCRQYLGEKYTELELQGFLIHADIPDLPIRWEIDTILMRRLFENILTNVQKHNVPGTNIYFRVFMENDALVTIMADDGAGIAPEIAEHIFEPFVKGDEARETGGGAGLGMAVAQKIAELHKGTICLVQPPEKKYSTEFMLWLRAEKAV